MRGGPPTILHNNANGIGVTCGRAIRFLKETPHHPSHSLPKRERKSNKTREPRSNPKKMLQSKTSKVKHALNREVRDEKGESSRANQTSPPRRVGEHIGSVRITPSVMTCSKKFSRSFNVARP
jgi:hypothetical protein